MRTWSAPPDNADPVVHAVSRESRSGGLSADAPLTARIFEVIRDIRDPEHPNTLEELAVVTPESVTETSRKRFVDVAFTPTVPHCSMASMIGLCIRKRVADAQLLPCVGAEAATEQKEERGDTRRRLCKLRVHVVEGTHVHWQEITKQLNDKERVLAALENGALRAMVEDCIQHRPPAASDVM
ncbi:hypothetical protein CDCA_CDCA03G0964 [Cyanidium caldarium]|uniref:MIP18 family-like domain-containing protein n=1 Tax=Cyanidium caldarium TaxID=2771 RepID=A0AAV9IRQ5_CYACA|nr:hypothetical protein CDCA_CDCA03G0964 [Cyanidium caldarium]